MGKKSKSNNEPEFIRQHGDLKTEAAREKWSNEVRAEFSAEGALFCRFSVHPEIPNLCLVEGWRTRPNDAGEPQWQLSAAEQKE